MKKITALVLALLIVMAFPMTAFASETTTLTTTVPAAAYTLNIPADQEIPFGSLSTEIGQITVTDSTGFAVGKNLKVTVSYNDFACEDAVTTIPYTLEMRGAGQEAPLASGAGMVFYGETSGEVSTYPLRNGNEPYDKLKVLVDAIDWGNALAGSYSTTITFGAEVVIGN